MIFQTTQDDIRLLGIEFSHQRPDLPQPLLDGSEEVKHVLTPSIVETIRDHQNDLAKKAVARWDRALKITQSKIPNFPVALPSTSCMIRNLSHAALCDAYLKLEDAKARYRNCLNREEFGTAEEIREEVKSLGKILNNLITSMQAPVIVETVAVCSEHDVFVKSVGRYYALRRALEGFPNAIKHQIWSAYSHAVRNPFPFGEHPMASTPKPQNTIPGGAIWEEAVTR